jgi:HSP20 family protein
MSQTWNPLQDLIVLQDRMNRLFEDATQRHAKAEAGTRDEFERADWTPAADICESETSYLIDIDLPGIDRSTLEIDVADNRLTVKGSRLVKEATQCRVERPRGKFVRSFGVPGSVEQAQIKAEYRDGVLHIALPKREEQKTQRVEIKVS